MSDSLGDDTADSAAAISEFLDVVAASQVSCFPDSNSDVCLDCGADITVRNAFLKSVNRGCNFCVACATLNTDRKFEIRNLEKVHN